MTRSIPMTAAALVATVFLASGCFHARQVSELRHELERGMPEADFDREVEFTFGPMSLGCVRLLTAFVPGIRQERGLLKEIDRIGFGAYRVRSRPQLEGFAPPAGIDQLLEQQGWEVAAKAREPGEAFWLLYRSRGDVVQDFYLVALEHDELFLLHMEGRLVQLVARALAMEHGSLRELFHASVDERRRVATVHGRENRNATLPDFWEVEQELPSVRYNRVDGLYVGMRMPPTDRQDAALYGELGYAFGGNDWRYQVGGEVRPLHWLDRSVTSGVSLGVEGHVLTGTDDEWLVSEEENTLTSLFVKRDFRDHYQRTGWSTYASHDLDGWLDGTVRLLQDDYESLSNSVGWSVFGGSWARESFRPNPQVDEIRITSLRGELSLDTRDSRVYPGTGWLITGLAESAGGWLGDDGEFERYVIDARHYQTLGQAMRLDLRARVGTSRGTLPRQLLYELGGYSSLRGYRFKEFVGDRMALANGEFWVDVSQYTSRYWFLDGLNAGLFMDAGTTWFGEQTQPEIDGRPYRDDPDVKASVGVALDLEDFRVHLARPLDEADGGWDVSFRISRSF